MILRLLCILYLFWFIYPCQMETNAVMTLKFVCGKMMRLHLFKLASNLR